MSGYKRHFTVEGDPGIPLPKGRSFVVTRLPNRRVTLVEYRREWALEFRKLVGKTVMITRFSLSGLAAEALRRELNSYHETGAIFHTFQEEEKRKKRLTKFVMDRLRRKLQERKRKAARCKWRKWR